jgi:uncharacterized integral membrane protein
MTAIVGLIITSIFIVLGLILIIINRKNNTSDFITGIAVLIIAIIGSVAMAHLTGVEKYTKNIINRLLADKKIEVIYNENKISYKLVDNTIENTYTYVIDAFNKQ